MNIYSYPFDQFQRYYTVTRIISALKLQKHIKVLEVGSNEHCALRDFLPSAEITFSDREEQNVKAGETFIRADATNLPFSDNEFDVVISMDVLEHVPKKDRESFIKECSRVAGKSFILACPIDNNGMSTVSEKAANDTFIRFHNVDHPWLKEHFEEGLPSVDGVDSIMKLIGLPTSRIECGKLDWWQLLMQMHFLETADARFNETCLSIYNLYNRHIYSQDFGGECYRSFWVVGENAERINSLVGDAEIFDSDLRWMEFLKVYAKVTEEVLVSAISLRHEQKNSEKIIEELNQLQISSASRVEELSQEKISLERKIAQQGQKLESLLNEKESLNNAVELLNSQNNYIQDSFNNMSVVASERLETISALIASTSWKVTMPLRLLSRILKGDWKGIRNGIANRLLVAEESDAGEQNLPLQDNDYQKWLIQYDKLEGESASEIFDELSELKKPLISIVMPVYNTDKKYLELCINSVIEQSYENWELCIADDASTASHVKNVLRKYSKLDSRIKINFTKLSIVFDKYINPNK